MKRKKKRCETDDCPRPAAPRSRYCEPCTLALILGPPKRPPGRPPADPEKALSVPLRLRVTQGQAAKLDGLIPKRGADRSEVVRRLIDEA